MSVNQTGIFYASGSLATTPFPPQYKRNLFRSLDKRFLLIFGILALTLGVLTFLLSLRELPTEPSAEEIGKIQERYARLVLNQPKPKPKPEPVVEQQQPETVKETEEPEEKPKEVDRDKETFVQRQQRKEESAESRRQKREEVSRQISSAGIFAAITSSDPSGGGEAVSDLLGATEVVADLGEVNVAKGGFATAKVDPEELKKRRGERTSGVGIEKQDVGGAATRQLASKGSVAITAQAPEISGEQASATGSQRCIKSVVNRESSRLKRVYETWLKRDPQLSGNLRVKFTILPGGTVSNVSIVKSTTGNDRFDTSILRYIQRWDFSSCSVASPLEIIYPFAFTGQ